jgi:hypothetical protein
MIRVALIAMPWLAERSPSVALGSVGSFLRRDTPHEVQCLYEYLDVCQRLGPLYRPVSLADRMGELIYAAHLYPEAKSTVRSRFVAWAGRERAGYLSWRDTGSLWPSGESDEQFERVHDATAAHLDALVARLAGRYDVIGFTTTFCQLFASLACARLLKEASPSCTIVLGGMGVAGRVAASVLERYAFIDYVIQGDGEVRLAKLLDAIDQRATAQLEIAGILDRRSAKRPIDADGPAPLALDALPIPDFSGYYDAIDRFDYPVWANLPVEVSRGWADGQPSPAPKSHARLADEVHSQTLRHQRLRLMLMGDVRSGEGVESLADTIEALGMTPSCSCLLPTTIHPYEVFRLWEAGCDKVEFDFESLSRGYLRRTGSGYGVIDVLQAMRICYELGIKNFTSLAMDVPGAIAEDLEETLDVVRRFAINYQPLELRRFSLFAGHAVSLAPERFGISRIRTSADFRGVLPDEVWQSLQLPWLDCDVEGPTEWRPLGDALASWNQLHRELLLLDGVTWFVGTRPLYYFIGNGFVWVVDRRWGHRDFTLDALTGAIYVHCMEIRTRETLYRHFSDQCDKSDVDEIVGDLVAADLMYAEEDRVLSLAVAFRVELAVQRLRQSKGESHVRQAVEQHGI